MQFVGRIAFVVMDRQPYHSGMKRFTTVDEISENGMKFCLSRRPMSSCLQR